MKNNRGAYYFTIRNKCVIFCVKGMANLSNSYTLKEFADQMLIKGYREFIFDLSECQGMDSTFMGTLAGIVNFDKNSLISVTVSNPNNHCKKAMTSLGITSILNIQEKPMDISEGEWHPIPGQGELASIEKKISLAQKAHENLAALGKENKDIFDPFLKQIQAQDELKQKENKKV